MTKITYQETVVPLGTLAEVSPALAYERGVTDGCRAYLSENIVIERTRSWPGWKNGFDHGTKCRKHKERME